MFKQVIGEDGSQIEIPDYWLRNGCPWEIQRNDVKYVVRFDFSVFLFSSYVY
jgi:starch phosphorylase